MHEEKCGIRGEEENENEVKLGSCLGQCVLRSPEGQALRREYSKGDGFLVGQFVLHTRG